LPPSETTIAERLRKVGYATGAVGKWHLGAAHVCHPNERGFEFFFGFLGGGHDYFLVDGRKPMGEGYFSPLDANGQPEPLDGYLTDVLTRAAVGFIKTVRPRPFFLYLAYNAPHTPMQAPPEYLDRFPDITDPKRRTYAAMVSAVDDGVGRVLETLNDLSLRESTLVFFLSDNGGPTSANASRNDPLRGFKGDVFEGGIRVPFIASWPGTLPPGTVYDRPVISIDVARTALGVGAADPGPTSNLDGVNLIPFLTTEATAPPHEALFWRKENGSAWAVRAAAHKLLRTDEDSDQELFDLTRDIAETENLTEQDPAMVARLHALFEQWNASNQPPRFLGFRDYHQQKRAFYQSIATSVE